MSEKPSNFTASIPTRSLTTIIESLHKKKDYGKSLLPLFSEDTSYKLIELNVILWDDFNTEYLQDAFKPTENEYAYHYTYQNKPRGEGMQNLYNFLWNRLSRLEKIIGDLEK